MQSAEQPHTSIRHIQGILKIHACKKTSPGKRFNARGEDECFLGGEQNKLPRVVDKPERGSGKVN